MDYKVIRIFGCGVDSKEFNAKYKMLSEEEKDRLERVAWRVWVTFKLRYELTTYTNPFPAEGEDFRLTQVEWPSLEVYLLFSCLDTLAGQPKHQDFKTWLKSQPNISTLELDEVLNLYDEYQEIHGVNRNLRNLFDDLPINLKIWLSENISIQRANPEFIQEEFDKRPEELVNRLFKYFYKIRRNDFTHSSLTHHTDISRNVMLDNEWWVLTLSGWEYNLDSDKPERTWNLQYRKGLDEATILRTIVHSVALQKIGIEITSEVVNTYINAQSKLSALYGFIEEVSRNTNRLSWWGNFNEQGKDTLHSRLVSGGIPRLSSEWATILIDRFIVEYPSELYLRQTTIHYLDEVNYLNELISNFNETTKELKGKGNERLQAIKKFVETSTKDPSYKFILEMPYRKEITNMWLIIRDPCYS